MYVCIPNMSITNWIFTLCATTKFCTLNIIVYYYDYFIIANNSLMTYVCGTIREMDVVKLIDSIV